MRERKPWVGVRLVAFAVVVPVRRDARARGPARHLGLHRRAVRHGLAAPPPLVSTCCASTGRAATSAAITRAVRAALRGRGARARRARAGGDHDAPRQHRRQRCCPTCSSAHAHGIGLRFVIKRELQMIPTIDIGGRWVPTFYVAPRLGRHGRRGRGAAQPRPRPRPRRGDPDLPRGHPVHHREARPREAGHRRAPARDRAAGRPPPAHPSAAARRADRAARRGRRRGRGLLRPRRLRRVRRTSRTSGAGGWSGRRSTSVSGATRRPRSRATRRSWSPGSTSAGRCSTTGSASSAGSNTRRASSAERVQSASTARRLGAAARPLPASRSLLALGADPDHVPGQAQLLHQGDDRPPRCRSPTSAGPAARRAGRRGGCGARTRRATGSRARRRWSTGRPPRSAGGRRSGRPS